MIIDYEDFEKLDIRSGTIIKAEPFERAKKAAYKIWVDFGPEIGIKQSSAQITIRYSCQALIGRQILGCINLGTKNIAGFNSEFLALGFSDENNAICLASIEPSVPNGRKMH